MILYYAAGGGLGHLTRMRALLHTLAIDEPVTLLAPPLFGGDRRVTGDVTHIPLTDELARNPEHYSRWLSETIERVAPSRFIIDTFPAGILGELNDLPLPADISIELVARALRWDRYSFLLRGSAPRFATTYVAEELPTEQQHYIESRSESVEKIILIDPPSTIATSSILGSVGLHHSPFWLVVHSGPESEISALLEYAEATAAAEGVEPAILLIAPQRPAGIGASVLQLDIYPATPFFPYAERIFTACGFNAMRQTLPWRDRHLFIPFERRYDDQQRRADARQTVGAGL